MEIKRESERRKDNRRPVEQRRPEPPFQSIGRLESYFTIPGEKKLVTYTSTAFFIGRNLIMAAAQSVYKAQFGGRARQIYFYPFKSDKRMKIENLKVSRTIPQGKNKYNSDTKYFQSFVVFLLKSDQTLQPIKPLQINWSFMIEQHVEQMVIIPGYSYDLANEHSRNRQYVTRTKPLRQLRYYLFYEHVGDLTGCPIILQRKRQGRPTTYEVIGIHNSNEEIQADGIVFLQQTKERFTEILQSMNAVENFPQKLDYSKSKLLKDNLMLSALNKKIYAELKDAQKKLAHTEACNEVLLKSLDDQKEDKQEVTGLDYASKTFAISRYYSTPKQEIEIYMKQSEIALSPHRYTLNHTGVKLEMNLFLRYEWKNVQKLKLSKCEIGNKQFWEFLQNYKLFPILVILILNNNQITTLPKQIQNLNTIEELNLQENPLSLSSISYIQMEYKNTVKKVLYNKRPSQIIDLQKEESKYVTDQQMSE